MAKQIKVYRLILKSDGTPPGQDAVHDALAEAFGIADPSLEVGIELIDDTTRVGEEEDTDDD